MKILYLTTGCFDKGGISRYNRYQIQALRALAGEENVFVYSLLGPGRDDFEEEFRITKYFGGPTLAAKIRFTASIYSWGLIHRPEIIVSAHVNLSGAAHALSRLIRARTILNVYGLEVWSGLRRDASWGLRSVDHVISDCHNTAGYLEEQGIRPKNSVSIVWDCVDLERFSPRRPALSTLAKYGIPNPAEGINILTLGRISRDAAYKGYERLLNGFRTIAERQPQARLIFAGSGNMIEELRAKACAAGLGDRVFFTGSIHEDDLADVYRSAHVFSLISDSGHGRGEGIPLTPLEANACGVPILVSNQDGSQEAVAENVNGFVLDPMDADKFAETLLLLTTDTALRERMGQGGRLRAEKEFGFDSFVEKHRRILSRWFPNRFLSTFSDEYAVPS